MIAGVVVCGNTGSAEAALGESEGNVAALASTGVGTTVETVGSGTGCSKTACSRLIDSTGNSVNVVTAGNGTCSSRGISAGSSGNDAGFFGPSNILLASGVGQVISSTLSEISAVACGAIAVTSVNSLIAETPAISGVSGVSVCKLSPFSAVCSITGPT